MARSRGLGDVYKRQGQEAIDVAQEALDAISAGDAKALDTALRAHYRACEEG
jgi:DNA-binding GntR family transcriptional regulator